MYEYPRRAEALEVAIRSVVDHADGPLEVSVVIEAVRSAGSFTTQEVRQGIWGMVAIGTLDLTREWAIIRGPLWFVT